ncbi:MAG TPA: cytochrome c [Pyrinomonadaceae bacterium]|jgi:mono/diheme cytochrome c family protein|nr:cytochrome c [Pyrinomonadaceae bacterium]
MKRWMLVVFIALALAAVVVIVGFTQVKLDALQEPGRIETVLATQAKHLLVRWSSREGIPPAPANLQASIEEGDKLYATNCSMCHGSDGHTPTDTGRWMYPRASDLTLAMVQEYSDRELFWIVKNGIRLSGMPGFGKVESDDHIWNLVHYIRTLQGRDHPKNGGETH